jgi:hypothetical protein
MIAEIRLGTSSFTADGWQGASYPSRRESTVGTTAQELGSDAARRAVGRKACHFVSTLAAVDIFRYNIRIHINNAFNDAPVALNTNHARVLKYGFESHEPLQPQLTNHTMARHYRVTRLFDRLSQPRRISP